MYVLILEAILATMEIVGRLAQRANLPPEELERYIAARNKIRKELVQQANEGPNATPAWVYETPENTVVDVESTHSQPEGEPAGDDLDHGIVPRTLLPDEANGEVSADSNS